MLVQRQGTNKRIMTNLKRHHELMQTYMREGMSKEDASTKAMKELRFK